MSITIPSINNGLSIKVIVMYVVVGLNVSYRKQCRKSCQTWLCGVVDDLLAGWRRLSPPLGVVGVHGEGVRLGDLQPAEGPLQVGAVILQGPV